MVLNRLHLFKVGYMYTYTYTHIYVYIYINMYMYVYMYIITKHQTVTCDGILCATVRLRASQGHHALHVALEAAGRLRSTLGVTAGRSAKWPL